MRKWIFMPLITALLFGVSLNLSAQCEDPISTFPWTESFEAANMPDCWAVFDEDGDTKEWDVYTSDGNTGSNCAAVGYNYDGNNDWLITPKISVTSASLLFEFSAKSGSSSWPESYNVLISKTDSMPASFEDTIEVVIDAPATWEQKIYSLADYANQGDEIFLAIQCVSYNKMRLQIDDFSVREMGTEADMLTFVLPEQTGDATFDNGNNTVDIEITYSSDITSLTPEFTLSAGASVQVDGVDQVSGETTNDFTSPLVYSVTSEDGNTTTDWTVTVTKADPSTETDIIEFGFSQQVGDTLIDATTHTVIDTVSWTADLTSLVANFELSAGAYALIGTEEQTSGVTANDFTNPVTYTIWAEDSTTNQDWTVTVRQEEAPEGASCANPFTFNLPADLDTTTSGTNENFGNVYSDTEMGYYDGDEEVIYELTVTEAVAINISMDPNGTGYTGIGLFDACPNTGNLIESVTSSSSTVRVIDNLVLEPGNYFLMIDAWLETFDYNLTIEEVCLNAEDIVIENLTQTTADVTWTDLVNTSWSLNVSTTNIDPETQTGNIFTGTVDTDPIQAVSGLNADTEYFVYVKSDCATEWLVDSFMTPQSCAIPENLTTVGVSANTALLSWDELGSTAWNLKVATSSINPTTDADFLNNQAVTALPYEVTGLDAETTYYFYVQSDCGADSSDWSLEGMFTTPCEAIATFPWIESFEDEDISSCWTILNEDNDANQWEVYSDTGYTGNQSAAVGYNYDGNDDWLITPQINITSDDLVFEFYAMSGSTSWLEDYNVLVSTTGTNPEDFTNVLENVTSAPYTWERKAYKLSDFGINQGDNVFFAIQCVSENELRLIVDDVTVREPSTEADILTYSFPEQTGDAVIDDQNNTVNIEVEYPNDLTALTADFTLSAGASAQIETVDQESGVTENDFSATGNLVYTVTAEDGVTTEDWTVHVTERTPYDSTEILTYSLPEQTGDAVFFANEDSISIEVDYPTDLTTLVASFTLSHGAYAQVSGVDQESGVTENDFSATGSLIYTVTAEDSTTTRDWTVTVTERTPNDSTDILTYSMAEQFAPAIIDADNHTVTMEVGSGTDLTSLIADFTLSTGAKAEVATVEQESGITENDFTTPVVYTITAEDTTVEQDWTITVTEAGVNTETDFLTFEFDEQTGPATIDVNAHTIDIEVNWLADTSALTADFTLSYGAYALIGTEEQESGVTVNNFFNPVTYTVFAEDSTTNQDWVVTVTVADPPQGYACDNPYTFTLPADLDTTTSGTNEYYGDMYSDTDMGSYDDGEDVIYELTITEAVAVNISMDPNGTGWTGIGLFDGCPDSGNLIDQVSGSSSDIRLMESVLLEPGTYYIMLDIYPSPYIYDYDLTIEEVCFDPIDIITENMTPTSTDIVWTDPVNTSWNLKVSDSDIDPTTEAGTVYDDVVNVAFHSLNTLTASTEYFVYVQSDCSANWVEYSFTTPASCPVPTNLEVVSVGETQAELTWEAYGSTDWHIIVDTATIDPYTQTGDIIDEATTSNPYTADGLTPNTTYYYYVQTVCGTDSSDWSLEGTFTTNCVAIATIPWTETFEDDSETRSCWSQIQETGIKEWTYAAGSSGGVITSAYEGTLNAKFTGSGSGPHITKLVSPTLDLSSITTPILDFYYGQENWSSDQNELKVYYRTDAGSAWTEILHFADDVSDWTMATIELPNPSATYQIAFEGIDNYGYANVIDNVTVREPSSEADIIAYSLPQETAPAVIDDQANTVDVEVAYGTDFTALIATFELSVGATAQVAGVDQESGVTENDFSADSTLTYTIIAEDGTTEEEWTVNVTEARSNETDFLSFSFPEQTGPAVINAGGHTILIEVAYGTDLTALVPTFTLSDGATATVGGTAQESGVTANDFTSNVIYTVTAENGTTTQDWTVITNVETGVDLVANETISVYPNPANEQFNINLNLTESQDVTVKLVDVTGKTVQLINYSNVSSISEVVNTESLADGIYNVVISTDNKQYTQRVVIK